MTRRDIIIISVLINAGLLAVLFITAVKSDPDAVQSHVEIQQAAPATEPASAIPMTEAAVILAEADPEQAPLDTPIDEVDHVLKEFLPEMPIETAVAAETSAPAAAAEPAAEVKVAAEEPPAKTTIVEVTVKRGDALEKIARANRTTVDAIRKENNMANDKLKIGQVLKVPVGTKPVAKTAKATDKAESKKPAAAEPVASGDAVYYTIKSGDNPWKIAKQYQLKFEDLLKLNNLDKDKAKNLKVGDKIRIK